MASVKFSGMIQEAPDAPADPVRRSLEHGQAEVGGSGGWLLAGIQQLSVCP